MSRNDLPSPSAPNFSDRLRETMMTYLGKTGDPLDRGITLRDLVQSGFASLANTNAARGGGPLPLTPGDAVAERKPDLTPPPTPSGFTATAAIASVVLSHDPPLYSQGGGHLRTRVYGTKYFGSGMLPVFASAVEIHQFSGTFSSFATDPSTTWHLWIKWETADGVLSASPAGGTNGVVVTTGQNVSLLLDALQGEITSSQLNTSLSSRIDLIDASDLVVGSVAYRLAEEASARGAAIAAESLARTGAITAASDNLQNQIDALAAASSGDVGGLIAAINSEQTTRLNADNTFAAKISTVVAANNGNIAALKTEELTRATQDSAQAGLTSLLFARTGDLTAGVLNEGFARTTADSAQAAQVNTLLASVGSTNAAVNTEASTRATADSAAATQLVGLKTSVDSVTAGVAIERTVSSSENQAVAGQVTALTAQTGANVAAIKTEETARATDTQSLAGQVSGMVVQFGSNTAAINSQAAASATADSARASQVASLTSSVGQSLAGLVQEQNTSATANSALATQLTSLSAQTGASAAGLVAEQNLRATADSAAASQLSSLVASVGGVSAGLRTEAVARATDDQAVSGVVTTLSALAGANSAAIRTTQDAFANADSAMANTITTLQASAGANTSAIQTLSQVTAGPDGATAQYTVKLDVNGYVSGFGLSSQSNSTTTSTFIIRADSLSIANPTGPSVAPAIPFIVRTTPTTIGGVNVPVGVYMTDTFIQNGTINNAKIANLAVDNAKIASMSVDKLTAGSIAVGQHIQSTGYVPGSAGWRIDGSGNAEFSNVTVRGTVVGSTITGGTITGATVRTAESGQRIQMDSQGLLFLTGATSGKYGQFKYGNARKYGSGVLVYFNNASKRVPFYVSGEQNVADIHLYNRGVDPTGATYEPGDLICVNGRLKIFVPALGGWKTLALEP